MSRTPETSLRNHGGSGSGGLATRCCQSLFARRQARLHSTSIRQEEAFIGANPVGYGDQTCDKPKYRIIGAGSLGQGAKTSGQFVYKASAGIVP